MLIYYKFEQLLHSTLKFTKIQNIWIVKENLICIVSNKTNFIFPPRNILKIFIIRLLVSFDKQSFLSVAVNFQFCSYSDVMKLQMGMGDKVFTFIQWMVTFIAGYTVGFVQGWKLTLVILSVAPLMVLTVGFIAIVSSVEYK